MFIALISCVAKKESYATVAKDLYISPLFKKAYSYAKKQKVDKIFILSARYGLLREDKIIEPYNETLKDKSIHERKNWAKNVLNELSKETDLKRDKFLILAGKKYREFIIEELGTENYEIPLKGLSIGKQLSFYKEALK
jgi:cytoplasmic iron level regulating protein YaaA (DUF328/UPF0246 family)